MRPGKKKTKTLEKNKTLEHRQDSSGEEGLVGNCNLTPRDSGCEASRRRFSEPISNMNLVAVFLSPGSCIIYLA